MLNVLKKIFFSIQKRLKRVKNYREKRMLQDRLDDIKLDLAWTLVECGKYEEELAIYSTVSKKRNKEMKFYGMGIALIEMGRYEEARGIFEKGLREFPNSYVLWSGLGILNDFLGDHFESLRCFEKAILYDSIEDPSPYYNKALALMGCGYYEDATEIIDQLLEQYPDNPQYLAEKGNCSLLMGHSWKALSFFEKALERFSEDSDPHIGVSIYAGLCRAYLDLGMKRNGMEIALEGLKRFPDQDPVLYHNAGAAFYEMGWKEEAIAILREGVKKFPEDEEMRKFLKALEDDLDDPDKGNTPSLFGFLLLVALIHKRGRRR